MRARNVLVAAAIALTAAGAAWGSGAVGAIVGADGTIDGCYLRETGQLRVVAAGEACRAGELGLQWSQKGPKGDRGEQGIQGPTGPQGLQGIQGAKGDQGDPGPQGPKGDTGAKGDRGDAGPQGPKGDRGDAGPQGPAGPAGGVSGYEVLRVEMDVPSLQSGTVEVPCPSGKKVVGGGYFAPAITPGTSAPFTGFFGKGVGEGWIVRGYNGTLHSAHLSAFAICVSA